MSATYEASRRVTSNTPEVVASAVREAIQELRDTLQRHGIAAAFDDLARLGHTESWDGEGQRWVHVSWEGEEAG
ncbi:hypothetical protein E5206_13555 [Arthrobacter sp. PAMC25564]|uniref:hypothetical protein n=1 Tax=Arthrobacter sp. PAMC25564 TaxID=2565366 RepID=UPI0010A28329|nr:hypothetical protein [Arthrobacter sp. PAMC25564]QCB97813.1 hypothetical protein E5206_13555 [Arthrobacter sp. PAMC25564]